MTGIFKHVLFFFVLAAACYVLANITPGRIGFIAFFVIGILFELTFYFFSWRRRPGAREARTNSP